MPSRRELVEHCAEREDVGLRRDRLPTRLLGRHVPDGPDDQTGFSGHAGWTGADRRLMYPRETEVEQFDVAIRPNHHVIRLDITMNDLCGMRDGERFRDLSRDRDRALQRQSFIRKLAKRSSLDELH